MLILYQETLNIYLKWKFALKFYFKTWKGPIIIVLSYQISKADDLRFGGYKRGPRLCQRHSSFRSFRNNSKILLGPCNTRNSRSATGDSGGKLDQRLTKHQIDLHHNFSMHRKGGPQNVHFFLAALVSGMKPVRYPSNFNNVVRETNRD